MDAKEICTGRTVAMELIVHDESPDELTIGTFLTSRERSLDSRNHCIPILRTLPIPDREGEVIIVMPYLRAWYDPRFKTIGEGTQLFKEMLEVRYRTQKRRTVTLKRLILQGLQCLHENHIAH